MRGTRNGRPHGLRCGLAPAARDPPSNLASFDSKASNRMKHSHISYIFSAIGYIFDPPIIDSASRRRLAGSFPIVYRRSKPRARSTIPANAAIATAFGAAFRRAARLGPTAPGAAGSVPSASQSASANPRANGEKTGQSRKTAEKWALFGPNRV